MSFDLAKTPDVTILLEICAAKNRKEALKAAARLNWSKSETLAFVKAIEAEKKHVDSAYEHTKNFEVGDVVTRTDRGDEHIILSIDVPCMTVKCIKLPRGKRKIWKIGEEEYNVMRRYQLIRKRKVRK